MPERWQAPGGRDTQEAEIKALEAHLLPCPHCGCKVIRLEGIDSYGFFDHARCTKCRARTRPEIWNKRVSAGQLALFAGAPHA